MKKMLALLLVMTMLFSSTTLATPAYTYDYYEETEPSLK